MQSTMTARLMFDFRGETFTYKADIVMPMYIDDEEAFLASIPRMIADKNQVNTYSYEFEIMENSDIEIIYFESRIETSMPELPMPAPEFVSAYQKVCTDAYLDKIAEAYNIDLKANPKISKALKAAYILGKEHKITDKRLPANAWLQRGFS